MFKIRLFLHRFLDAWPLAHCLFFIYYRFMTKLIVSLVKRILLDLSLSSNNAPNQQHRISERHS